MLPDDIANDATRFHPALRFNGASVGGMLALFRDIRTNEPCGIHRTFLNSAGHKLKRKMLGRARDAAIKLDPDENVALGLCIGEGVETCLAARLAGFRPIWALSCAGAVGKFPPLAGIEALAVLVDNDSNGIGQDAARTCANRWAAAGREVRLITPNLEDTDIADILSERAR
jgi:hypothetical protein